MDTLDALLQADNPGDISEQLRQEQETNLLLQEALVDLQLAAEDAGWQRLGTAEGEFTREGLKQVAAICRLLTIRNPLIRRGVNLRIFYVWGSGVQVSARATGQDSGQDVNAVVQAFLDDPANRAELTGQQAGEENERALGTDGNVFFALFTSPLTGRVQVRSLPFDEITEVICDPEDKASRWFYKREWTENQIQPTGMTTPVQRVAYYPALGYRPQVRPKQLGDRPILWDAPVACVQVNRLKGWKFGLPDTYAAADWATAYKVFLEDWARLVKALSRYAWRTTAKGSKLAKVQAKIAAAPSTSAVTGQANDVGATALMDPSTTLEAIPKTGATIDSESGRPLAMMVASALDVPVTMLLADPGQTGARAVAETLDRPTELAMDSRRKLWTALYGEITSYVIDQAVKAPRGPLQGTVRIGEDGREVITLADEADRTVDVVWPDLDEVDPLKAVQAVVQADQTNKLPPLLIARLLMQVLGVDNIDELLEELTDEEGNFVSPDTSAGQVAVDAFRRGEDPAEAVR